MGGYTYEKLPSEKDDGSYDYKAYIDPVNSYIVLILGLLQGITASLLMIGYIITKVALVIENGWRKRIEKNQSTMIGELKQV